MQIHEGVEFFQCNGCLAWKPKAEFYPLANPRSVCGIKSVCKRCDIRESLARRRERARLTAVRSEWHRPGDVRLERIGNIA